MGGTKDGQSSGFGVSTARDNLPPVPQYLAVGSGRYAKTLCTYEDPALRTLFEGGACKVLGPVSEVLRGGA